MGFYGSWILPRLIDWRMRQDDLSGYRRRIAGAARGRVLEIGVGSGLNLRYFGPGVSGLVCIDPSIALLDMTQRQVARRKLPVALLNASAEAIPLRACSVDAVVMTWTLCSIRNPERALAEIRRVLRPGGELHFVEHGASPDVAVARWQDRLTPFWKHVAGGCHLDREVEELLRTAGFEIVELRRGYMPKGPRLFTYMFEGRARERQGSLQSQRSLEPGPSLSLRHDPRRRAPEGNPH